MAISKKILMAGLLIGSMQSVLIASDEKDIKQILNFIDELENTGDKNTRQLSEILQKIVSGSIEDYYHHPQRPLMMINIARILESSDNHEQKVAKISVITVQHLEEMVENCKLEAERSDKRYRDRREHAHKEYEKKMNVVLLGLSAILSINLTAFVKLCLNAVKPS